MRRRSNGNENYNLTRSLEGRSEIMTSRKPVVLVGIDGSTESGRALHWACNYARSLEGTVHAVTVWRQPVQFGYRTAVGDSELEKRAKNSLTNVVDPVREEFPDVALKTQLIRGHEVDELVGLSHQADLMVLGNKGHGAFTGMMVGSIALKLVHHARCPVTIVR